MSYIKLDNGALIETPLTVKAVNGRITIPHGTMTIDGQSYPFKDMEITMHNGMWEIDSPSPPGTGKSTGTRRP